MLDKIKNVLKNEATETETKTAVVNPIPPSKYSFVEQYVIADTDKLMNGGYELWELCKFTPVAYESSESTGWLYLIDLPSSWAQPFLKLLKQSAPEIRKDPRQRLISVIHLNEKRKIYVIPDLEDKTASVIVDEHHHNDKGKNDWVFYVTPEARRAIVEQVKTRSRAY